MQDKFDDIHDSIDELTNRVSKIENKPADKNLRDPDPTFAIPLSTRNKQAIDSHVVYPVTVSIVDGATAANYDVFFTANVSCQVMSVTETHRVLGTNGGAVTLTIEKLTSGQALDAGSVILSTALSLKTTINTPQYGVLLGSSERVLKKGDRLALKDSGTLTAVAGVNVTIYLRNL